MKASASRPNTPEDSMAIARKMYRSHNYSYLWLLRTSASRAADHGSIAVRVNAEGKKESTQVEPKMSHFPLEKGTLSGYQGAYHLHDQGQQVQELH